MAPQVYFAAIGRFFHICTVNERCRVWRKHIKHTGATTLNNGSRRCDLGLSPAVATVHKWPQQLFVYLLVWVPRFRACVPVAANCWHGPTDPSTGDGRRILNIWVVDASERIYLVEEAVTASEKKLLKVSVAAVLHNHHQLSWGKTRLPCESASPSR